MKKGKNNSEVIETITPLLARNPSFRMPGRSQTVASRFAGNGYLFGRFLAYFFGYGFLHVTFPAVDNFLNPAASFPQVLFAEWITLFPFLLTGLFSALEFLYPLFCAGLGYLTGFALLLFHDGIFPMWLGEVLFFLSHLTPVFLFPVHKQRPSSAKLLDAMLLLLIGLLGALIKYVFLCGH